MGGLAYGTNLAIYQSRIPGLIKGILIITTGILAVVAWLYIARWVMSRGGLQALCT